MTNNQKFIDEKIEDFEELFGDPFTERNTTLEEYKAGERFNRVGISAKDFLRKALTKCSRATADAVRGEERERFALALKQLKQWIHEKSVLERGVRVPDIDEQIDNIIQALASIETKEQE